LNTVLSLKTEDESERNFPIQALGGDTIYSSKIGEIGGTMVKP
jgi:hypothetical protein